VPIEPSADPRSFDSFAADYDRFTGFEEPGLGWLAHIDGLKGRRALDAGCGSGRRTVALAERFDEVVGVDLSRPLVEIARARRSHPRVRLLVGDLMDVEDPEGFDLVFSSTVLHHLPDRTAALDHLKSLVRRGGLAVLVDNVAPRPTPPRWAYRLGSLREFPRDARRHGLPEAVWLLRFRNSRPWLGHLAADRHLSRSDFEQRSGATFPGARFVDRGFAHAMIWRSGDARCP
jgi:SAM-dependent methyltransferase